MIGIHYNKNILNSLHFDSFISQSSLIHAILRELSLSKGSILVHGVVSYASQQPWLFAGSVQRNILFGLPMDRKRYNKVR